MSDSRAGEDLVPNERLPYGPCQKLGQIKEGVLRRPKVLDTWTVPYQLSLKLFLFQSVFLVDLQRVPNTCHNGTLLTFLSCTSH